MVGKIGPALSSLILLALPLVPTFGASPTVDVGPVTSSALPSEAFSVDDALAIPGGTGPAGAMPQLAQAALAFARAAGDPSTTPLGVLEALGPLVTAHAQASSLLAPGTTPLAGAAASVAEAQAYLEGIARRPGPEATAREWAAWSLGMQPRPEPFHRLPAFPRFGSVVEALHAHFDYYGVEPTPEQEASLERFGALPPGTAQALTRIIEAHLFAADATRLAFTGAPTSVDPVSGVEYPFDAGMLMQARDQVADIVLANAPLLEPVPTSCHPVCGLHVCDVILINLTVADNLYACDVPLSIDLGGNDTFAFNSGGTMAVVAVGAFNSPRPTALHIDRGGNDDYGCIKTSQGVNGAANLGSGFLFDFAGDDDYSPTMLADGSLNGGARLGVGLFIDVQGDDTYFGNVLQNGSFAGGAVAGVGHFMDLGGNDTYNPTYANAVGAFNGGALLGRGFLLDAAGHDVYTGTAPFGGVANGAAAQGAGVLLDLEGNDIYQPYIESGGAAHGAALAGGTGILIDVLGNDSYKGTILGPAVANGAARLGVGLLVDLAGEWNEFLAPGGAGQIVDGASVGGLGLILSAGEADEDYFSITSDEAVSTAAGDLYGLGIVVDRGGDDELLGGSAGGVVFGAGRSGGAGIWVDTGGFDVLGQTNGLGLARGAQGLGLVLRPNPSSHINVADYVPSSTFAATGGGVGLWLDNGTYTVQGQGPVLACSRTAEFANQPLGPYTLRVCQPDPDGQQNILEPVTGTPLAPVPKEPVPCSTTTVGSLNCGDEVGNALGENWVDFLESDEVTATLSGGLEVIVYRPTPEETSQGHLLYETIMVDRTCGDNCEF